MGVFNKFKDLMGFEEYEDEEELEEEEEYEKNNSYYDRKPVWDICQMSFPADRNSVLPSHVLWQMIRRSFWRMNQLVRWIPRQDVW